jgi:hypothetical protein
MRKKSTLKFKQVYGKTLLFIVGLYFVMHMILYVCVFYSNLKHMKTITMVLIEKWYAVGIFCC